MSGPIAATMKSLGIKPKPIIEIKLSGSQKDAFAPSYTSLEEINGEVSITTQTDLNFDDIYITFEGATRTYVEKIATTSPTNAKTEAFQNFLRLVQPVDQNAFPHLKVLEANKSYKFPFHFVVPERLLPQSCTHPKDDNFPEGAHLRLPPSLGDPMVASVGKTLMNDMAPDMGSISYAIKIRLTSGRGSTGKHLIMAETTKKLCVIPAVEEDPPLNVEGGLMDDYRLRKEKSIKKGIFRQTLGRLTMESAQPKSLRLPSIRSESCCAVTTMATVNIRFDPVNENAQPPKLSSLCTKLKVATFYGSTPLRQIPTKSTDFHYSSVKGIYVDTIPLSQRCLANAEWQHHTPHTTSRGDSGKIPEPSCAYNGNSFYTARVVVPVSLPQENKVFVPSFHSCLVSRIYALDLYLSISTPNATVKNPTLHLKLPIQVSSEGNPNAEPQISLQEASAISARSAPDYFNPRSVAPPSPEYTERALLASPNYSPRGGLSPRDSIAEDTVPPSPGPGWSHRPSLAAVDTPPPSPGPGYNHRSTYPAGGPGSVGVRMVGTQQRFQSLSFEDEEATLAIAPPPGYSNVGGMFRERIASSVPSPVSNRSTRPNSYEGGGI